MSNLDIVARIWLWLVGLPAIYFLVYFLVRYSDREFWMGAAFILCLLAIGGITAWAISQVVWCSHDSHRNNRNRD